MSLVFKPETHEYFLGGVKLPGVSKILEEAGFTDFSKVPAAILERSIQFGNNLHKTLEYFDQLCLDEEKLDASLNNCLDGWKKFLKDSGAIVREIERPVCSERFGYAGTLDRVLEIKKKLILVDIKSSETLYPATALQTVGYKIAYEEETRARIRERWCIRITLKGRYKIEPYESKTDDIVFRGAVAAYYWKKKHNLLKGKNNGTEKRNIG